MPGYWLDTSKSHLAIKILITFIVIVWEEKNSTVISFLFYLVLVQYQNFMDPGCMGGWCWINSHRWQRLPPPTMPLALTLRAFHQWQEVSLSLSLSKLNVSLPKNFIYNDFLTRYELELHMAHIDATNKISVAHAQFYQIGEPDSFLSKVKNPISTHFHFFTQNCF